jgi:hypothetical protein
MPSNDLGNTYHPPLFLRYDLIVLIPLISQIKSHFPPLHDPPVSRAGQTRRTDPQVGRSSLHTPRSILHPPLYFLETMVCVCVGGLRLMGYITTGVNWDFFPLLYFLTDIIGVCDVQIIHLLKSRIKEGGSLKEH